MRVLGLMLVLAMLACGEPLRNPPGGVLVGSWSDAGPHSLLLSAGNGGATLSAFCLGVRFTPIRLSDSLTFKETGVITASVLIGLNVGDPYTITGRVVGSNLVVNQQTLAPGNTPPAGCTL